MLINFKSLTYSHFPLLLTWLNKPHVKTWWDKDITWTLELIEKKYESYINGYKLANGLKKPINAYIIFIDNIPIGYIQIYNAYDFPRAQILTGLPQKLAAFDIFIGEEHYLHKGFGSAAIKEFLNHHCPSFYTHAFADPNSANIAAIRAYEKAGFKIIKGSIDPKEVWMIKELFYTAA